MVDKIGRPPPPDDREAQRRDRLCGVTASGIFGLGLGMASLLFPLVGITRGFGAVELGILVVLSGLSQMVTRFFLGPLMRIVPDKNLVMGSTIFLAISTVLLFIPGGIVVLAASQLLQGTARALFWTGNQTHAVRTGPSSAGALSSLSLASGIGLLIGPALAGFISETSTGGAVLSAAGVALIAALPASQLLRLAPFQRISITNPAQRFWRIAGGRRVVRSYWMGFIGGGWRALLNSHIPVLLSQRGASAATLGIILSAAEAGSLLGGYLSRFANKVGARWLLSIGGLFTTLPILFLSLLPLIFPVATMVVALSGLGAGLIQTFGPAVAADSSSAEARGDAIASAGTYRSFGLLLTPLIVSALVVVFPLGISIGTVVCVMSLPPIWSAFATRKPR